MARLLAASVLVGVFCPLAPATTFTSATTKHLVDAAQRVCCVRCEAAEPRRHRSGFVFTHVRLRLLEDLKGETEGRTIHLRVIGGRTANAETRVPGMPKFKAGGECVVILGRSNREGYPVIVGARRGVIGLEKVKKGAREHRRLSRRITGFKKLKGMSRVSLVAFRAAVGRAVREQHEERARKRAAKRDQRKGDRKKRDAR